MPKHLTHDEFAKKFLDEFIDESYKSQDPCTRIMGTIFDTHREEVKEHLNGCLAFMDNAIADGYSGTTHEHVGYNFHKGFRQIDPIDAPLLNGIVWTCMQQSDLFWNTLKKVADLHDTGKQKVDKSVDDGYDY